MIVSHAHEFIFIKSRKTGGTSVEIALSKYLGAEDIATPITPEDEEWRISRGWAGAQNYRISTVDYGALDWLQYFTSRLLRRDTADLAVYKNHMPAKEVRRRLGRAVWSRYFSFTIERNPWDKVVSGYYWRYREGNPERPPENVPSFDEYVRSGASTRFSDFKGYSERGQPIVDRVLRYEDLQAEISRLASDIGLPEVPDISRSRVNAKSGIRPEAGYRPYYTAELRDIVAKQFAHEIALMGYEF